MDSHDSGSHDDAAGAAAADHVPEPSVPERGTRRQFLRDGGIAAAGLVVGGAIGAAIAGSVGRTAGDQAASVAFPAVTPREVPGFDHVVVLMGENRSFDNLLGWL